jgi:hypothetical protein
MNKQESCDVARNNFRHMTQRTQFTTDNPYKFYHFNVPYIIFSKLQIYNQEALDHPTFGIE